MENDDNIYYNVVEQCVKKDSFLLHGLCLIFVRALEEKGCIIQKVQEIHPSERTSGLSLK